jgi:hypothetical protein
MNDQDFTPLAFLSSKDLDQIAPELQAMKINFENPENFSYYQNRFFFFSFFNVTECELCY